MNKILNYAADQFVFFNLKKISNGYLNLVDCNGKEYSFGDNRSLLKAKIKQVGEVDSTIQLQKFLKELERL